MPLGIYLVSHPISESGKLNRASYLFHGMMRAADFARTYKGGLGKLAASVLMEAFIFIVVLIGVMLALACSFAGVRWLIG